MSRRGPNRVRLTPNQPRPDLGKTEDRMVETLDELADFQAFKADILPKIREQLRAGAPTKDILNTARAVAVGRLAMIAALDGDSKTALTAIKELLERTDGKVSEKREIKHMLADMPDEELDALLITAVTEDESSDDDK